MTAEQRFLLTAYFALHSGFKCIVFSVILSVEHVLTVVKNVQVLPMGGLLKGPARNCLAPERFYWSGKQCD